MSKLRNNREYGFTLVELSIVIIIIGLLIASTAAGIALLRQAETNAVIVEVQRYRIAVNTFRQRYDYLPGDFSGASAYWPTCGGGNPTTCNGNGDGVISWGAQGIEDQTFWEQLSRSGLIAGKFTYTGHLNIGVSIPRSKQGDTYGYWARTGYIGNDLAFVLGSQRGPDVLNNASMSPGDASNIDKKFDDGNPGSGYIVAARNQDNYFDPNICINKEYQSTASSIYNATYLLNDKTISCVVIFEKISEY